jgi:hypothetical protein
LTQQADQHDQCERRRREIEAKARADAQLDRLTELRLQTIRTLRDEYRAASPAARLVARTVGAATVYRALLRMRRGRRSAYADHPGAQQVGRAYAEAGAAQWRLRVLSRTTRAISGTTLASAGLGAAHWLRHATRAVACVGRLVAAERSPWRRRTHGGEAGPPGAPVTVEVFASPLMRLLLERLVRSSAPMRLRGGGAASDSAAIATSGADAVLVVDGIAAPDRGLLERLVDLLDADPQLGAVSTAGWILVHEGEAPRFSRVGADSSSAVGLVAPSAECMLLRGEAARQVGNVGGYRSIGWEIELGHRLRNRGWALALAPGRRLVRAGDPSTKLSRDDRRLLYARLGPALRRSAPDSMGAAQNGRPTSFVFEICAADRKSAEQGGDYHLAVSLARALRRRGHPATVHTGDERARLADACYDVRINVRGREELDALPGQLNVLWLISHPEDVTDRELERHDLVFVASRPYASELAARVGVPVHPLLQFTDPETFFPIPRRDAEGSTIFVGNWRGSYRQAVWDARATGADVALYGAGWRYLWPEALVREHVAHAELRELYGSCAVLLNDHWPDMLERGFVSNRLFDALACGTFVVSDRSAAVEAELGEGLVTYEGADELRAVLARYGARRDERERVAERGRRLVLERHTVEQRASRLMELVEGHTPA